MILQNWVRQTHRWLGMILTLTILINFALMTLGPSPPAIVYAPLVPLALLIFSGLFMFFQRYSARGSVHD